MHSLSHLNFTFFTLTNIYSILSIIHPQFSSNFNIDLRRIPDEQIARYLKISVLSFFLWGTRLPVSLPIPWTKINRSVEHVTNDIIMKIIFNKKEKKRKPMINNMRSIWIMRGFASSVIIVSFGWKYVQFILMQVCIIVTNISLVVK